MSNFLNKVHDYKNNIDPVEQYIKQTACYLSKKNGKTVEENETKIREYLKNNPNVKNPTVIFRERDVNGNLVKKKTNLYSYIQYPKKKNHIMVPSFTVYFNPKVKRSLHSDFIDENVAERNKHKKLAFKYEMEGKIDLYKKHNTIQKTKKIFNNSLSGAYASSGTILYNPSAHYTLTSITRCVSGTGNSLSEQVITGNRHFATPHVVKAYIAAVISQIPEEKLRSLIDKYNLYIPTPEDLLTITLKSTRKYWQSDSEENNLLNMFRRFNDLERVWYAYLNDLYHFRVYNDKIMRDFFYIMLDKEDENIRKEVEGTNREDLVNELYSSSVYLNLLHHLRADVLKGKKPDYNTLDIDDLRELVYTLRLAKQTFNKYDDLLTTFLITDLLPINIAFIKNMLRETIVLSDTDSTCATYEDWVKWYQGDNVFGPRGIAITGVIMTIATTAIDHGIKVFAANMNIPKDRVSSIAMKNEYYWDVFVPTNVSKHYFADTWVKEGNVLPKSKNEIKGVNLIASNVYEEVRELELWLINDILHRTRNKEQIPLKEYLKKIIRMEQLIINKVLSGSPDVLRLDKIKEEKAYKAGKYLSPYFHYLLWQKVFAPKYGNAPDPMYMAIKVPITTDTKNKIDMFLQDLEKKDPVMANNFRELINESGKVQISTLRLPLINTYEKGLPEEIKPIIDYARTVFDNCNPLYMVLETIGYFRKPDKMISDIEPNLLEEVRAEAT
jgi:hypothetical protein